MAAAPLSLDADEVERALRLLTDPGSTFEIRALGEERGHSVIWSGWFRDPAAAASEIRKVERNAVGVYVTLNPVKPELYAKCANRLGRPGKGGTTGDAHIVSRTRLLIDVDAERPSGISATEDEHAAALSLASEVWHDQAEIGWPEPLRADSGNGGHLVYGIDLPVDDDDLVKRVLAKAAERWTGIVGGHRIKVDTSVFNPARISKVYGTVSRKGEHGIDGREHRVARIIAAPPALVPVTREQLEAFAGPKPVTAPRRETKTPTRGDTSSWPGVPAWLTKHGIAVRSSKPNNDGGTIHILEVCPLNSEHDRGEATVTEHGSGAASAKCQHESCHLDWPTLRAMYDGTPEERRELRRREREWSHPEVSYDEVHAPALPHGLTVVDGGGGKTSAQSAQATPTPEADPFDQALATALAEVRGALSRGAKTKRTPLFSVDAVDILDRQYADTAWLVSGLITEGGVVMIGGEPKTTKTWLATEICLAIASGTKVCGEFFAKFGIAAYFYAEDLERQIRNRCRALLRGHDRRIPRGRFHLCPRGQFLDITRDEDLAWLVASARELGELDLLVLDPFRDISSAAEDKSDEIGPLMKRLRVLGELVGCTVAVVHHLGKMSEVSSKRRPGQRMRGSGAIHGSTDSGLYLTDSESDSPTEFKNTLDSEIKGARSAGTVEIRLVVIDDDQGEAISARWEIDRTSRKEQVEQQKEKASGDLKSEILSVVRSMMPEGAPSANAIVKLLGGNRQAALKVVKEMSGRELAYKGGAIVIASEVHS